MLKITGIVLLVSVLTACIGSSLAPVEDESVGSRKTRVNSATTAKQKKSSSSPQKKSSGKQHVVRRGDTLFSIAFAAGYDYRKIANWNGIKSPYTIVPGEVIRLKPPQPRQTKTKRKKTNSKTKSASSSRKQKQTSASPAVSKSLQNKPVKRWIWPTQGKILNSYAPGRGHKGLNIVGRKGTPVRAAAAGKVVYAGSGLKGYGNLVIIKHNDIYLSAYAHNRRLLVREGSLVSQGQKIGEMGNSDSNRVMLHFEIRKRGTPVNPIRYLPRRS